MGPRHAARGTVAIFAGRAEFIEKYFEVVGRLLARGFAVATLDWRGQGGSARQLKNPRKGHIDDFSLFERDLNALVDDVSGRRVPNHGLGSAIRWAPRSCFPSPMPGAARSNGSSDGADDRPGRRATGAAATCRGNSRHVGFGGVSPGGRGASG